MRMGLLALALMVAAPAMAQDARQVPEAKGDAIWLFEKSIDQIRARLDSGEMTSERLTRGYLYRIAEINPRTNAVIAVSPEAIDAARASDARRKAGKLLGPLDGIPVLIKDNIETRELPTTAGSLALKDNHTGRDAPVVEKLRTAGAVILGKTNLSEWANIRSTRAMSGWSAVGGLVHNPYALDRTACGSSSGSGAAVADALATVAVGTETDGSVVCPAAMTGLVGLKPTLGLVSRTYVVPISHSQDTPGPMARSVKDTALLFSAMIGSDLRDAATRDAEKYRKDYAAGLSADALKGMRVGYWKPEMAPDLAKRFDKALDELRAAGAILVEVKMPELDGMGATELLVMKAELKADLALYLASTPATVKVRTLADVIALNEANAAAEMTFFGQEIFLDAEKTKGLDDPLYKAARAKSLSMAKAALDGMLKAADARVLVSPTYGTPWLNDPAHGDQFQGPSASELPAISGYPHLTVPMGLVSGLPAGLSFIGPAFSDGLLLNAGYAYEQATKARAMPLGLSTLQVDLGPRLKR